MGGRLAPPLNELLSPHYATPAPTTPMILLKEVVGRLQAQVKQTTQAVNRLHNLLARVFPELATLTDDLAAGWVLRLLTKSSEHLAEKMKKRRVRANGKRQAAPNGTPLHGRRDHKTN